MIDPDVAVCKATELEISICNVVPPKGDIEKPCGPALAPIVGKLTVVP